LCASVLIGVATAYAFGSFAALASVAITALIVATIFWKLGALASRPQEHGAKK
jgi:hypothetical protein